MQKYFGVNNMSAKLTLGLNPESDRILHIDEVQRGLACACVCPECNGKLEAAKGLIRQHHFRHHSITDCKGGFESALHKYAKQVIVDADSVCRTKDHTIKYKAAIAEILLAPYRPDVTLKMENEEVYVEVFVSNAVKEIKKDYFVSNQLKAFEIDLSWVLERNQLINLAELSKEILENYENRNTLYWPEDTQSISEKNEKSIVTLLFSIGLLIIAFLAFGRFLKKRKRK